MSLHVEAAAQAASQMLRARCKWDQMTSLRMSAARHVRLMLNLLRRLPPEMLRDVQQKRDQMTSLMWSAAGIVRRTQDMRAALDQLRDMYIDIRAIRKEFGVAPELQELLNLVTGTYLVICDSQGSTAVSYSLFPEDAVLC